MRGLDVARSFLFVPGDRPERFGPALGAGADIVVVDLEDAVAPGAKERARANVVDLLGRADVMVRINDPRCGPGRADVARLAGRAVALMVAKAEDPTALAEVRAALRPGSSLVPLVETARGVLDVRALAVAPGVARLAFGHLDLCAELGLRPDDVMRLAPARFALVAASAAAGLPAPVDGVCPDVRNAEVVRADARNGLDAGFTGKLCIHPAQIPPVHAALTPSPEEVARARRIVDGGSEHEVRLDDGQLVDRPVHLRAQSVLARAAL